MQPTYLTAPSSLVALMATCPCHIPVALPCFPPYTESRNTASTRNDLLVTLKDAGQSCRLPRLACFSHASLKQLGITILLHTNTTSHHDQQQQCRQPAPQTSSTYSATSLILPASSSSSTPFTPTSPPKASPSSPNSSTSSSS